MNQSNSMVKFFDTFSLYKFLIEKMCFFIRLSFFVVSLFIVFSCDQADENKNLTPIAQVYDQKLYFEDVMGYFPDEMSKEDSVKMLNQFVDDWIVTQVFLNKAQKELKDQSEIDRKVQKFKNDLMIHYYIEQKVNADLDTSVSDAEVKEYYKKHKDEFLLKDYLVKVLYLKVSAESPGIDEITQKYKLRNDADIAHIQSYAQQYALNFYYDSESWIYFEELTKEIPLKLYNKENFILNKSNTKIEEDGIVYYLNIIDYRLKDAASPLEFEVENIKNKIINKRILRFKEDLKESLIKNAYDDNKIEILY